MSAFPHGLRGVLPRACLPAGEAVATPPSGEAGQQSGASYSGAAFGGLLLSRSDATQPMQGRLRLNPASHGTACPVAVAPHSLAAHPLPARETPSRGGSECVPATISAFVNEWIGPAPRVVVPRDFTFKAVIGEPSW